MDVHTLLCSTQQPTEPHCRAQELLAVRWQPGWRAWGEADTHIHARVPSLFT